MLNTPLMKTSTTSTTILSTGVDSPHGLVWNADLTLQSDTNPAALQRRLAIDQARRNRPRTARIEREIMLAVVLLYVLILGSFAGLHWYGHITMVAVGQAQNAQE